MITHAPTMPSVAPLLAAGSTEGSGVPAPTAEYSLPSEQPLVRSLVTHLPPHEEVWNRSYRPEPGWEYQNLESILSDRNRELQVAAVDGWVLQTTVSISSPADGGVTILDTLCRLA